MGEIKVNGMQVPNSVEPWLAAMGPRAGAEYCGRVIQDCLYAIAVAEGRAKPKGGLVELVSGLPHGLRGRRFA